MGGGKLSTVRQKVKDYLKKQKTEKQEEREERVKKEAEAREWGWVKKRKHHCSGGPGGQTHAFLYDTCVPAKHIGHCPVCLRLYEYNGGCNSHGYKKEQLWFVLPADYQAIYERNREAGLLRPN